MQNCSAASRPVSISEFMQIFSKRNHKTLDLTGFRSIIHPVLTTDGSRARKAQQSSRGLLGAQTHKNTAFHVREGFRKNALLGYFDVA